MFMKPNKTKSIEPTQEKKTEILNEALNLFASKGYHATTLDEIAEKVGVTQAALYYYFKSKAEIVELVIQSIIKRMEDAINVSESDLSSKEKLREFITYHIQYAAEHRNDSKILFEQIDTLPMKTREFVRRKEKADDEALQNILKQGVEGGNFALEDIKIVSYGILGICNWVYRWYKPEGRLTIEEITNILVNLLENGYLNRLKLR